MNTKALTTRVENHGVIDEQVVKIFTLINANGMKACVTEYGASLVSLEVPDKDGTLEDVTLGYDTFEGWKSNESYMGSTVGRYGNRIADGKFKLDGEEGYPGTLQVTVIYWLTNDNELAWVASATTDKATPVNIIHHTYWNLTGDASNSINEHLLQIEAVHYLPTNSGLIPTGEIAPVKDTAMDFNSATAIGKRVNDDLEALKFAGGYDHCWVLAKDVENELYLAATLRDPKSGRVMEVLTDQPAIQFYGGNFLDGTIKGKGDIVYNHRTGLCLETQQYPDSPNQPSFPNVILEPGETYKHRMIHRFPYPYVAFD